MPMRSEYFDDEEAGDEELQSVGWTGLSIITLILVAVFSLFYFL